MRCWLEVSRKTEWTIQGLGLTLFSSRYTIRATHTNYLHVNSLLTLIGVCSAHMYAQVIASLSIQITLGQNQNMQKLIALFIRSHYSR